MSKIYFILSLVFLINQFIFPEKYTLHDDWYYSIGDYENPSWKRFDAMKSLENQGIMLNTGGYILYKHAIPEEILKRFSNDSDLGIYFGAIEGQSEIYIGDKSVYICPFHAKLIYIKFNKSMIVNGASLTLKIKKNVDKFACRLEVIPFIDYYEKIKDHFNLIYMSQIFVGFFIFLFGLYYLLFYSSKLRNREFLLFFLLCSVTFINVLLRSPFKYYLLETLHIDFMFLEKIEYFALYSMPYIGFMFFINIFDYKSRMMNLAVKITGVLYLLLFIFVIFADLNWMNYSLLANFTLLLFCIGANYYISIKSLLQKKYDSIFIIIGLTILSLFAMFDVAGNWDFISVVNRYPIYSIGTLFFVASLAIYISNRFVKANLDLISLTNNLEHKVNQRTLEIESISRQKTTLFINIAHEIRTPLTLIRNYIDKFIRKNGLSDDMKVIRQNVSKLQKDIVNFIDTEKLERGQVFYDHVSIIDLSEAIRMKILLFKEIAAKKKITFESGITNNIFIKIDPFAIDRILNNILDNALKFNVIDGKIIVRLKSIEGHAIIDVIDTGKGVNNEDKLHIFEPYYQSSIDKRNINGIGMGLYIVKKIMDELKGKIEIYDNDEKGSDFRLTFIEYKLKPGEKAESEIDYTEVIGQADSGKLKECTYDTEKKNVFVVEDNIELLVFIQEYVSESFNFYHATDGKDALEKLKIIPKPDVIISDIMMGGMDGYGFHEELSKIIAYKSIPFIFLTAKSGENERIIGLSKGAVDFISKPFLIDELLAKIKSITKFTDDQKETIIRELSTDMMKYFDSKIAGKHEDINLSLEHENISDELYIKHGVSKKEIEIIHLLDLGYEYKEIGNKLNISINTVREYIRRLYLKCGVNNKMELTRIFHP